MEKRYLSIDEFAQLFDISKSYAYELAKRRAIPVIHIGRLIRVPADALEAWLVEQIEIQPTTEK